MCKQKFILVTKFGRTILKGRRIISAPPPGSFQTCMPGFGPFVSCSVSLTGISISISLILLLLLLLVAEPEWIAIGICVVCQLPRHGDLFYSYVIVINAQLMFNYFLLESRDSCSLYTMTSGLRLEHNHKVQLCLFSVGGAWLAEMLAKSECQ